MNVYSIKDVEHLSGIKAHTLRIWEQRYDLLATKRTDTNIRYYDQTDLKLILNVSLLNKHGYKISKISKMNETQLQSEVIAIADKTTHYDDQLQALTLCMLDLDEEKFEEVIDNCISKNGFENAMIQLIYPFLTRIGVLWHADAVSPSQEHFISYLIRQKVIVAINSHKYKNVGKKYLLFLPEGENHELTLLFSNYLLRAREQRVVYLGQSLPINDVKEAYKIHKPENILCIITSTPNYEYVQAYINQLSSLFPEANILFTGAQVIGQGLDSPENVLILNKIDDLLDFIKNND